jgi:hypothetical protein
VVVETHGDRTYVGRYDNEDEQGMHLIDVGVHDGSAGELSKEEYLRKTAKFGVRTELKHLLVPRGPVARISRLAEVR